MPYPFILPTTSFLSFANHLQSATHPSLPVQATTTRATVRSELKSHKRLPPAQRPAHLSAILAALQAYTPHLLALSAGLSGTTVAGEHVEVVLVAEIQVEWRPTLSSSRIPGREPDRARLRGLDAEIAFTLATLAAVHCLLARAQLHALYDKTLAGGALDAAARTAAIAAAMKHYMDAHAVYSFLIQPESPAVAAGAAAPIPPDITTPTLTALAELALAEATLLAVLKDDPFPALIAASRNANDTDWMVGAPTIPKVRAHLFARLCLAAAEHAARGLGLLKVGAAWAEGASGPSSSQRRVADDLVRYLDDLRRTARAKACRFLGIDAEADAQTGRGIAYLRAAKAELSASTSSDSATDRSTLAMLKSSLTERREDKRIARGGEWGADAGRLDEMRVLDLLDPKWSRMNDTVNVQPVPPAAPLLATLPSGREYHTPRPWIALALEPGALANARAAVNPEDARQAGARGAGDDDSPDEEDTVGVPPGAFPRAGSSYY